MTNPQSTELERLADIVACHVAYRPWSEMADDRSELKLKMREDAVPQFDINEPTRSDCTDIVLAILQALRDPSEEMQRASVDRIGRIHFGMFEAREGFRAQIDHIIAEKVGNPNIIGEQK